MHRLKTSAYSTPGVAFSAAAVAAGSPVVFTTCAPSAWTVAPSFVPVGMAELVAWPGANLTITCPPAAEAGAARSRAAKTARRALRRKRDMLITNASMPRIWRAVPP
jgi:hypothetical protein